ncbi:MAG: class I SAM-dependent methyltransferase, partial [Planctomycetota bacterium]|nr:class I SAM-dependent methyltransferase [Planctomycetota bacterium]
DPRTTELRRRIIVEKPFLRRLYREWYDRLWAALPPSDAVAGEVLEIGSGGGFLQEVHPEVITSECFPCAGVNRVIDAQALPFADQSLRGIVMVDVLHHIPNAEKFLSEVARCLRGGATLAMVEPWNNRWARFVWTHFHHEPFLPATAEWNLNNVAAAGPLSRANSALPWIIFDRDREQFSRRFPALEIAQIAVDYPFSYLLSGGVSMRNLMPEFLFRPIRAVERILPNCGLFAMITVRRR